MFARSALSFGYQVKATAILAFSHNLSEIRLRYKDEDIKSLDVHTLTFKYLLKHVSCKYKLGRSPAHSSIMDIENEDDIMDDDDNESEDEDNESEDDDMDDTEDEEDHPYSINPRMLIRKKEHDR